MVTRAIQQRVEFAASPEMLFEMYMDSKKHTESTGGVARVNRKAGAKFTAWDGMLAGKNLLVIPNKLIVQSWRGTHWKKTDPDSILIIQFSKSPRGGRVDLVHVNVPEDDHKGVTNGWHQYYWRPWKAYIAKKRKA